MAYLFKSVELGLSITYRSILNDTMRSKLVISFCAKFTVRGLVTFPVLANCDPKLFPGDRNYHYN